MTKIPNVDYSKNLDNYIWHSHHTQSEDNVTPVFTVAAFHFDFIYIYIYIYIYTPPPQKEKKYSLQESPVIR